MVAFEIQLRYVIREKTQSEKKILLEKNCLGFPVHKVSCLGQIDVYHH